jgi:hypothetical protein
MHNVTTRPSTISHIVFFIKDSAYRISHWESWHWLVKYILILPVWLWLCWRARSLWFFTSSNPTLTFGGFVGETKKEMYDQLPPHSYPKTFFIKHETSIGELERIITNNLSFPVAVKPDTGRMGLMFRKIESFGELYDYHRRMSLDYLLQEFVDYPVEVSVFYYRFPGAAKGHITGFIKKECLSVTGDGTSTLLQLIESYPRVRFRHNEMKSKHANHLDLIIPAGEKYILSHALNLSRGGQLISLEHEKDERLLNVFDKLSHYAYYFYFGRYDIKCASIEDLKNGENFKILEFNGGGAEPHHVYGNGNTLLQALKILTHHWYILFLISRKNDENGFRYWSFKKGYAHFKKAEEYFGRLKKLDSTMSDKTKKPKQATPYLKPEVHLASSIIDSYVNSKN